MKTLIPSFLMLISSLCFSQGYLNDRQVYSDYLLDKNNNKISCNIREIKNGKVKFQQEGKFSIKTEDLSNFKDVKFSKTDIVKNPLNIKVEKPNKKYSYIYFYAANDRPYTVMQNKKKVVRITKHSYYLYKVEANKTYELYCSGNSRKKEKLTLKALGGRTYIVKGIRAKKTQAQMYSGGVLSKLVIDNSKLSKYALLTMSKKAKG
jgi:hypothetical protein